MKVAAIQMVSGADLKANLTQAESSIAEAAAQGAELVALPEYFCLLGLKDTDKLAIQETPGSGPIQDFLSDIAQRHKVWLVGGTIPFAASDAHHVLNTTLVFAPDGSQAARYDKIHLFRYDNGREAYDEARVIQAGHAPVTFDLPSRDGNVWKIGLSVCYDLRFPELYRSLAADLILVPSAFTYTTGRAHWEVLLRARAIENLAWVLAPAQGGTHENGRRTWGHSMLVDPWGTVVMQRPEGEGIVLHDADFAQLIQCRSQLPALDHRVLLK